jgi:hypothetical protein
MTSPVTMFTHEHAQIPPYMHYIQTVGQNEKNKQKLHKLTPDKIRPDREEGVLEKIQLLRVGSLAGQLCYCM